MHQKGTRADPASKNTLFTRFRQRFLSGLISTLLYCNSPWPQAQVGSFCFFFFWVILWMINFSLMSFLTKDSLQALQLLTIQCFLLNCVQLHHRHGNRHLQNRHTDYRDRQYLYKYTSGTRRHQHGICYVQGGHLTPRQRLLCRLRAPRALPRPRSLQL